jgi:hypothetical protein
MGVTTSKGEMMSALTLWDAPAPYVVHSATSREAAYSMKGKTASLRVQVLEVLKQASMTDEQLADHFDMPGNTIRPRRVELWHADLICEVGIGKTRSGRKAVLWGVK